MAAVLGLMVGATGPSDAGVIYTYSLETKPPFCTQDFLVCGTVTGSFSVDSAHFNASGITDISSFMTDLSFTVSPSSSPDPENQFPTSTFDPASGFLPLGVTVTPAGVLTDGSNFNLITSPPSGSFTRLSVGTEGELFVPISFLCCDDELGPFLSGSALPPPGVRSGNCAAGVRD
jgi:hypothetical protein